MCGTPSLRSAATGGRLSISPLADGGGATDWFAENFSLYFAGCQNLVDPQFTDLIKEMIDHAYKI